MGGSLVGSQLVLVMDLPAPPTIHGVDTISSSYSSGASHGFFNSLFDFYSSISTKHNTRRFPGNDLQKEIHAIKSVRAMAFSGIRLDLVRNVSRHFQMKHTLQFVSKAIPSPRYVNITQFDSDFKQLSARLWNSVAMSAQFVPVAGVIKGNLISSTVLTREPNAKKPDRNANTLTTSVRVKSHSDREKSKEEPFLESLGVELAMPGSSWCPSRSRRFDSIDVCATIEPSKLCQFDHVFVSWRCCCCGTPKCVPSRAPLGGAQQAT